MIWKRLLHIQRLKSKAKKFVKKNNSVLDIIIYGSVIRGKKNPRDIDIAILLKEDLKANKKLELAQRFKETLEDIENPDVKSLSFIDLIDPTFLANSGILSEGYLLLKGESLSKLLGFKSYMSFTHSLKNLTNSEKSMFRYTLKGRRGEKGLLKKLGGRNPARGLLLIPIEHSDEFENILSKHKVKYKNKVTLWKE